MPSLPLPLASFIAGLISFVTPCVLPLVPGYVSLISGAGVEEIKRGEARLMRSVLLNSVLFILGFTLVFMALGAVASTLGQIVQQHFDLLSKLAGLVIIVLGLHQTGLVPIKALYRDKRFHGVAGKTSATRAFLVGLAFGFGWTPCVGPILTVILTFAASEATIAKGIALLALYSAGLAVPFVLTSLGIERFLRFYGKFRRHLRAVEVVSGALLIAVGILIFTRHFSLLNSWMNRIPFLRHLAEKFL
jgi:cytochrome c-type biogenesis protein